MSLENSIHRIGSSIIESAKEYKPSAFSDEWLNQKVPDFSTSNQKRKCFLTKFLQ